MRYAALITLALTLSATACNGGAKDTAPVPTDTDTDTDTDTNTDSDTDTDTDTDADLDGDGYTGDEDCDEGDPSVHVGADDVPDDGIDQDCSGQDSVTCYTDADADGYGDPATAYVESSGFCDDGTAAGGDCDDADGDRYPTAPELCDGGIDNDCDPKTEDAPAVLDGASYASIQDALDDAPSAADPTVEVCDGTYTGNLVIDSDLTLVSHGGAAATILDGGGSGSVITVTGSAVAEIIGFTIQNGGGTSFKGKSVGGGVYVDQGTDVTIRDGRIVNNFAQIGAGLSTTFAKSSPFSANIALHDTEISYNVASLGAGAIYSFANMVLDNCEVAFNTASIAAGVAAVGFKGTSVTVDATGTVIHGNETSKLAGGGLYLGSDVTWTGGEVFENAAYEGAGLFVESSGGGPTVVQDVRIYENYASANGAGAYANAPLELIDTVFEANIAGGDGGGLYVDSPTTMTGGALLLNGAARGGGAYIYTSLTATSVDMGADATDNTPQDVMVRNGTPWNWDGVASFTCADASCL